VTTPSTIHFDDNALLPLFVGAQDAHLKHIEQSLDIDIRNRSGHLTLTGNSRAVKIAEDVLTYLWGRLKRNRDVTIPEIDSAIRFAKDVKMTGKKKESDSNIVIRTKKKSISPRSPGQAEYIKTMYDHSLVFGLGPAGTGKTYLAVAIAVSLYLEGKVERLILCRPAIEAGERLGFLPGDMKDKIDPYLRPIYDSLQDMMPYDVLQKKMETGEIEVAPLAFMRGRTLSNAFVILDEAQNATVAQMKMLLTRMGENSRMVVTGDTGQCDLPKGVSSGLKDAVERLSGIDQDVAVHQLGIKDVVRHKLVGKIIRAYDG
jgi:phosphate starvation-inducible PhoH-like protein